MIIGLRTAVYPCQDVAAADRWYRQVLGCQPCFESPEYVGFEVGGFELGLVGRGKAATDGVEVYWGVDNIEAETDRLLSLGARPLDAIRSVGMGIRIASLLDPSGNRFSLIENPEFDLAKVR